MHLILTHEQADFDAIASLLGVSLLDGRTIPVLPHRLNRNVRAFLSLYGAELPFIETRDLESERVDSVVLVDTQSLVTVKGLSENTTISILDHHKLRPGLPSTWNVDIQDTGAVTTRVVEQLVEHSLDLSLIHATLLLLGIYEDTGSLTYGTTTVRDVRAAAFLFEAGADIKIVSRFLNPPLSTDQRKIYDQLVLNSKTYHVQGYRIVIASGDASSSIEEISSLAHKLRDLLDPDALFILVTTIEGTRLVARSMSDGIDVAAVAAYFGGGGHDRAAAALIRPENRGVTDISLPILETELLEILPRFILPPVTVAQIMSSQPLLISARTSLQEAAKLMDKYGYEGYPVMQDNKVVGLLTRRVVDRALAHKLNLNAASLMQAGEVFVHPGDPVQHLQAIMTETGWGQIPVLDADNRVTGIVTRTDLIKTLSPHPPSGTGNKNVSSQLINVLPKNWLKLLKAVTNTAEELCTAIYVVGGFVRDLLLDRPSSDFDLVVEGDAIALAKNLCQKFGGRVTGHSRFGTAKWYLDDRLKAAKLNLSDRMDLPRYLDLITARTEFYERPSALPIVERSSIKLDLHRRDFTFNTLAIRLDGRHYGELIDHWGGLSDLRAGLVRVLHSLSFVDDPTRILRAVRFEQRFGFNIEPRTMQLMKEARDLIERLSSERVGHEIDLILDEPNSVFMLERLRELDLFKPISRDLPWNSQLKTSLSYCLEQSPPRAWGEIPLPRNLPLRRATGYLCWLTDLVPSKIHTLSSRLHLPVSLRAALLAAHDLKNELNEICSQKASKIFARLEDVPVIAIYTVWLKARSKERKVLETYIEKWRTIKPLTNGHTLMELGLLRGPNYQKIIRRLRDAWLDEEINSEAGEKKLLEQLINQFYVTKRPPE